jgi:hypothetical protein
MHKELNKLRSNLAAASKRNNQDPSAKNEQALEDARRDYWAAQMAQHIADTLASAPPLTEAQLARIATLLVSP